MRRSKPSFPGFCQYTMRTHSRSFHDHVMNMGQRDAPQFTRKLIQTACVFITGERGWAKDVGGPEQNLKINLGPLLQKRGKKCCER